MEEKDKEENIKSGFAWRKWIWGLVIFIIVVPFILFILLQIPVVQKWSVDRLTSYFSNKMNTKVEIDKIDLSIWRGLELDGFYVEDQSGDTLIYSEHLEVGFQKSLFSVFSKELSLDDVRLVNGHVNVVKRKNESKSNVEILLASFGSRSVTREKKDDNPTDPYILDLKIVHLKNVHYRIEDENLEKKQSYKITEGIIEFDELDLENGNVAIKRVFLDRPDIIISRNKQEVIVVNGITRDIDTVLVAPAIDSSMMFLTIDELEILEATFKRFDERTSRNGEFPNSLDVADMELTDLNLKFTDLRYSNDFDISLEVKYLTVEDQRGFSINEMSVDTLMINSRGIDFKNFKLQTNNTEINNDLSFTYNEFSDFRKLANRVFFKVNFDEAKIGIGDLTYFLKDLNKNKFFINNKGRQIVLDGKYYGRLNKLSGRNVKLYFNRDLQLEGSFDSRNISDGNNALINLKVQRLTTNINFLEELIPGFKTPNNFEKIGDFNFSGRFDGYFKDFVAFGSLNTELGRAELDMRLDIKNGTKNANYSGEMGLVDFDLGAWTDDDNFGVVNFNTKVSNGKGLSLETAYADLTAKVESFDFKGYIYDDFILDGQLRKNKFNGVFKIDDENANFEFDGNVELREGRPYLDFQVDIKSLDLKNLNLAQDQLAIRGNVDVNMNGKSIDDLVGNLLASNLKIQRKDSLYVLDTISISSKAKNFDSRILEIYSDIGAASIDGQFRIDNVVNAVKKIAKDNYPFYTRHWSTVNDLAVQNFDFDIYIKDSENIFALAGVPKLSIRDMRVNGRVNSDFGEIAITSSIPFIGLDKYQLFGWQINFNSIHNDGSLMMNIDSSLVDGKSFNPIDIIADINGDTININVKTDTIIDSIERLDIIVQIFPDDRGIRLHLENNELIMLGNKWQFSNDNRIVLGKEYIDINNLSLTDDTKKIILKDINNEGVELQLENVDFAIANPFIDYDKMLFGGMMNMSMKLYKMYSSAPVISGTASIDEFLINNENFGKLEIDIGKTNVNPYEGLVSLVHPDHVIKSNISFNQENNILDATLKAKDLPLRIFEFIIPDGISETVGKADLDIVIKGPLDDLDLQGDGLIREGAVKVDYLGSKFFFDDQPIAIDRYLIDLTDDIITDSEDNVGLITGGIKHDLFSEFVMDLNITADNAIVLNTTKRENPLYYGYAQGKVSVDFDGPFDRADLKVEAITGPNTVLNVPVSYYQEGYDESFVRFVDRDNLDNQEITIINSNDDYKIKGLNIEMNVTLTKDAEMRIIFDESRQDILEGRGDGAVQMYIDRFGAFDVFGEFEIANGQYLFTSGEFVKKPFIIKPGGIIRWNGDPLDATLDIDANYIVRTPLNVFLAEYMVSNTGIEQEARSTQTTELILDLTGTIFKPIINFDIAFPDLQGELKTYADSKLRTLRTNEIELNNQVVQLIVFQTFLSSDGGITPGVSNSSLLTSAAGNTLSELVSNQLSNLLTGLLSEALSDNGLISGIDFKVGLRNNSGLFSTDAGALNFNEVEVDGRTRFRFLNERMSLKVGGNFVRNEDVIGGLGSYIAGNVVLEYFLTDERKLKVRLYGTSDIDFQSTSRRGKYGFGFGYRTEFGTLSEFQDVLRDSLEEVNDSELEEENKN